MKLLERANNIDQLLAIVSSTLIDVGFFVFLWLSHVFLWQAGEIDFLTFAFMVAEQKRPINSTASFKCSNVNASISSLLLFFDFVFKINVREFLSGELQAQTNQDCFVIILITPHLSVSG